MRRFGVILLLLVLLLVGGSLTAQFVTGEGSVLSGVQQTNNPSASTLVAEPWQAEQFILLVGFLLFNLIGIGATIALIMWYLDRNVRIAKASSGAQSAGDEKAVES